MTKISPQIAKYILFFAFLLSALFCFICFCDAKKITRINISEYSEEVPENLDYAIEDYVINNNILQVNGWVREIGKEITIYDISVVLHDVENGIFFELPTQYIERKDVTEFFNDGINYDNSGFISRSFITDFDLERKQYEACIAYRSDNSHIMVHTNLFVGGDFNEY